MASAMIALTACEKAVLPEEGLASEEASLVTGSAKLNIFTSTPGDSEEETIAEGKVYIFNSTVLYQTTTNSSGATTHYSTA